MTRSQSRRGRARLAFLAMAILPVMAWMIADATVASASTTSWSLRSSAVPVKNSHGYTMQYSIYKNASGASVYITLSRRLASGNHPTQSESFSFSLAASNFSCTSTLASCTLNTGTKMGKYGKINQKFKASAAASTHIVRCKDQSKADAYTTRKGHTGDTFTLHTYNTFFGGTKGTLTNAGAGKLPDSIPATVAKNVHFKDCPSGGGGTPCFTGFNLSASATLSNGSFLSFNAHKSLSKGNATFSASLFPSSSKTAPAGITRSMSVSVPRSNFTVNSAVTQAHVNGNAGATFFTGTTNFTGPTPIVSGTTHCKSKTSFGNVGGNLAFHFDGLSKITLGKRTASLGKTYKV